MIQTAIALGSVALSLIVAELGLRIVQGEPLIPGENLIVRRVSLLRIHTNNQYDPLLGWVLKENMSNPGGVSTGQYGLRLNTTQVQPVVSGGVLASGDSFTAGSEVLDHESWPAYLEQDLGVPTYNAATGGWGSDQILLRVEQLLPTLRPRLVIVSFLVDDIDRSKYRIYGGGNKPYFQVEDGKLVHHNDPVPPFSGRIDELGGVRSVLGRSVLVNLAMDRIGYTAWWRDGQVYESVSLDPVEVSTLLMQRLKERLDREQIPLLFVLQYGGGQITGWDAEPSDALQLLERYRALDVACIDTWQPLKAVLEQDGVEALQNLYVMHDEGKVYGHMSAAGNRFIAGLLEPQARTALASNAAGYAQLEP